MECVNIQCPLLALSRYCSLCINLAENGLPKMLGKLVDRNKLKS